MPRPRTVCTVLLYAGLAATNVAPAAPPTVETVVPAIGRRGGEFHVLLTGGRLKDAQEILFYGDGLACRKIENISDSETRVTFAARADCRLGAHPFRVRTPGGLSELKVVHVSRFPVVAESEPNDDRTRALAVPMDTTIAGVIDSGDVDVASVVVKKGDRISAEMQAIRLGGEMTDTVLAVFGPDGRQLARADDTAACRQDPFASIVAPADGMYTVHVQDSSFGGGPGNTYALHLGSFARPLAVFPPGGRPGQTSRFLRLGPDGESSEEAVSVPGDAGPWWDYYPAVAGCVAPTPTLLRIRPYACVDEADLAESAPPARDGVKVHDWPVAFHGTIGGRRDVDAYAVRAIAGDRIQVEAFAERVGSTLDAVLDVYGPDGELVARNDDDATHDSRVVFRAATEGTYRVEIGDKRLEGGRASFYRIEVEQPRPSLTLFLPGPVRKTQGRQVIAIPRGNRVLAHVGVRRDGFDAPVRIHAGSLPKGVTIDMKEVAADTYLAPVVLEAASDAPLGASLVDLKGTASTRDGTVEGGFSQVVDLVPGPGETSYESVTVAKLAVVVTEAAPYRVRLSTPAAALERGGAIDLTATVERAGGFDEPVEVSLPYLPPGVEMEGPGTVPPGRTETVLRLSARPDADPATWRLAAEARPAPPRRDRREMTLALMAQINPAAGGAAGGRRRRPSSEGLPQVASPFVMLELTPPTITGKFAPAAAEQGQTVAVTCTLEQAAPPPGAMVAELEGLPPRASARPVELAAGARRVEFQVSIAPTTPAGEHATLACRLTGKVGGQAVVYRAGRGGLLKVNAPGSLATGRDARPLSPLDALRLKARAAAVAATPNQTP